MKQHTAAYVNRIPHVIGKIPFKHSKFKRCLYLPKRRVMFVFFISGFRWKLDKRQVINFLVSTVCFVIDLSSWQTVKNITLVLSRSIPLQKFYL